MSIIILNATVQCRFSIKLQYPVTSQGVYSHTNFEFVVLIKYFFRLTLMRTIDISCANLLCSTWYNAPKFYKNNSKKSAMI